MWNFAWSRCVVASDALSSSCFEIWQGSSMRCLVESRGREIIALIHALPIRCFFSRRREFVICLQHKASLLSRFTTIHVFASLHPQPPSSSHPFAMSFLTGAIRTAAVSTSARATLLGRVAPVAVAQQGKFLRSLRALFSFRFRLPIRSLASPRSDTSAVLGPLSERHAPRSQIEVLRSAAAAVIVVAGTTSTETVAAHQYEQQQRTHEYTTEGASDILGQKHCRDFAQSSAQRNSLVLPSIYSGAQSCRQLGRNIESIVSSHGMVLPQSMSEPSDGRATAPSDERAVRHPSGLVQSVR